MLLFFSQGVSRSRWATWNMRSQHMKTHYGITRCPCQDLHKLRESRGSRKIIQR
jgi:hypothetical protein